jgi:hypothetical protein
MLQIHFVVSWLMMKPASDTTVSARTGVSLCMLGTLLMTASPVRAFGPMGHEIIGEIAMPLLCRQAKEAVISISGEPNLASAGLWADRIRDEPLWDHALHWHFLDVADGESIDRRRVAPGGDLLSALKRFHGLLLGQKARPVERREALLFLIHLVADLHQPLHVGRPGDSGGNKIELVYRRSKTNLHRLWDSDLLSGSRVSAADYAWALRPIAVLYATASPAGDFSGWAEESRALRQFVYAFPDSRRVSRRYALMARAILDRRIAQAGVRLAGLLNAIYCES